MAVSKVVIVKINMVTINMVTKIVTKIATVLIVIMMMIRITIVKNVNTVHIVQMLNKYQQLLYPTKNDLYHNNNINLVTFQFKFHPMVQYNNHV